MKCMGSRESTSLVWATHDPWVHQHPGAAARHTDGKVAPQHHQGPVNELPMNPFKASPLHAQKLQQHNEAGIQCSRFQQQAKAVCDPTSFTRLHSAGLRAAAGCHSWSDHGGE